MKLDKAIKALERYFLTKPSEKLGELDEAAKLGTEALKYVTRLRACSLEHKKNLLPGETATDGQNSPEETLKKLRESPLGREPIKLSECPFEHLRDYPGCYEDCPDVEQCPHSIKAGA